MVLSRDTKMVALSLLSTVSSDYSMHGASNISNKKLSSREAYLMLYFFTSGILHMESSNILGQGERGSGMKQMKRMQYMTQGTARRFRTLARSQAGVPRPALYKLVQSDCCDSTHRSPICVPVD